MSSSELELQIPPAELVDVEKLHVDKENPNVMSARQFEALKKSIKRWGFIVPIITNRDYLHACMHATCPRRGEPTLILHGREIAFLRTQLVHIEILPSLLSQRRKLGYRDLSHESLETCYLRLLS